MTDSYPASWNPLRCSGTALPVNVLLMAKLVTLSLVVVINVRLIPEPFLPFIPIFDHVGPPARFQLALQLLFVAAGMGLLLNRWVRTACLILGLEILVATASSRVYYGNHKLYAGLLLFLAGLEESSGPSWRIRGQVALIYLGASLDKVLDPDWRSGRFFDYFTSQGLRPAVYSQIASWLPALTLSKFMSWVTISWEFGLFVALVVRRIYPIAIWGGILFHSGLTLFTGSTFGVFFYGTLSSFLLFAPWPQTPMLARFDSPCEFCLRLKKTLQWADVDRQIIWKAGISSEKIHPDLSGWSLKEKLFLSTGRKEHRGFAAIRMMLLYTPVTYFVMAAILMIVSEVSSVLYRAFVVLFIGLFSPFLPPIAEMCYVLIMRSGKPILASSMEKAD